MESSGSSPVLRRREALPRYSWSSWSTRQIFLVSFIWLCSSCRSSIFDTRMTPWQTRCEDDDEQWQWQRHGSCIGTLSSGLYAAPVTEDHTHGCDGRPGRIAGTVILSLLWILLFCLVALVFAISVVPPLFLSVWTALSVSSFLNALAILGSCGHVRWNVHVRTLADFTFKKTDKFWGNILFSFCMLILGPCWIIGAVGDAKGWW